MFDEELTNFFPSDARKNEIDMHGGFNEDSDTGMVYTGIPGYGLCRISPDLKTWEKIGNDSLLEENIHGLVLFKHNDETLIAATLNDAERVLIVTLEGEIR